MLNEIFFITLCVHAVICTGVLLREIYLLFKAVKGED